MARRASSTPPARDGVSPEVVDDLSAKAGMRFAMVCSSLSPTATRTDSLSKRRPLTRSGMRQASRRCGKQRTREGAPCEKPRIAMQEVG